MIKKFLTVIILLGVCLFAFCSDFSLGNFIPKRSSATSSAGSVIIVDVNGYYDLTPDGNSKMHFVQGVVGGTGLSFSSGSSATDTAHYNESMLVAIVTTNKTGKISGTIGFEYDGYNKSSYSIPYLCILVKVSGFDERHNSYSTVYSDWYGDSSNTYTVVAAAMSNSGQTLNYTIEKGECIHVVHVPFSYQNTVFWGDANPYSSSRNYSITSASYTYRHSCTFSYDANGTTGTDTDGFQNIGKVTSSIRSETRMSVGFTPDEVSITVDQLLENNVAKTNKVSTFNVNYIKEKTSTSETSSLYVTLYPYYDNYCFVNEKGRYFLNGFKLSGFSATASAVQVDANNHDATIQALSSTSEIDTGDYKNICIKITTQSSKSGFYYNETGILSFDVYPYIKRQPSVEAGDYSSIIVAEFSAE